MSEQLIVSVGQYSDKGRKPVNQDFHGALIPEEPALSMKGVSIALADGISSSNVSQEASEAAVTGFLSDYYCTPDAWSVKTSVQKVLAATNSWLYSQTRRGPYRYNMDKGYVCTFCALVIKSATAYLFHVGDSRIYRVQGKRLEQLTEDHRLHISSEQSYLNRALGFTHHLELDFQSQTVEAGDQFVLATDGVFEFIDDQALVELVHLHKDDLDKAAQAIVRHAFDKGSDDNLSVQIVRVDQLPSQAVSEIYLQVNELVFPPELKPRMDFDGYRIVRQLHASSRSRVFLAVDQDSKEQVILKTPAVDLRTDELYLERFLMEEWIARRISSAHVLKPCDVTRKRNYIYLATEFIEGQTLKQWMIDHPNPDLETVRGIIEQLSRGLRAFHKLEMLHQDLKPDNVMIDSTGTVKIIDFGSTRVEGLRELEARVQRDDILGTHQYTAPEYFLGENGTPLSDQFSLGVLAYQLLSGRLPYGAEVAKARTRKAQNSLVYQSVLAEDREIPVWVDETLRRAVHPNPLKRYEDLSEFVYDLRHPSKAFLSRTRPPLIERDPLKFWKSVSLVLLVLVIGMVVERGL